MMSPQPPRTLALLAACAATLAFAGCATPFSAPARLHLAGLEHGRAGRTASVGAEVFMEGFVEDIGVESAASIPIAPGFDIEFGAGAGSGHATEFHSFVGGRVTWSQPQPREGTLPERIAAWEESKGKKVADLPPKAALKIVGRLDHDPSLLAAFVFGGGPVFGGRVEFGAPILNAIFGNGDRGAEFGLSPGGGGYLGFTVGQQVTRGVAVGGSMLVNASSTVVHPLTIRVDAGTETLMRIRDDIQLTFFGGAVVTFNHERFLGVGPAGRIGMVYEF